MAVSLTPSSRMLSILAGYLGPASSTALLYVDLESTAAVLGFLQPRLPPLLAGTSVIHPLLLLVTLAPHQGRLPTLSELTGGSFQVASLVPGML